VDEPLAQALDRATTNDGSVALEVHVDELGERELGSLAAQHRLDHVAVMGEGGGAGRERACGLALAVVVVVAELLLP
jgi:hypothetical protein